MWLHPLHPFKRRLCGIRVTRKSRDQKPTLDIYVHVWVRNVIVIIVCSLLVPKNTGYTIFYITCIYQITSIGTWVPIHHIIEGFKVWHPEMLVAQAIKDEGWAKLNYSETFPCMCFKPKLVGTWWILVKIFIACQHLNLT